MKIFLDSADLDEILPITQLGIIEGITTNPTLIARAAKDFSTQIIEICKLVQGDVSVEVVAEDYAMMIGEGERIRNLAENIVVKLPININGIKACKYFVSQKVKVNMTLCFNSAQALFAAKAGATYISPFVGRIDDMGYNGIALIQEIRSIFDNNPDLHTKILAASIRHLQHFTQSALNGSDAITLSSKLIYQLIDHPQTLSGTKIFTQDWAKSKLKI